MSGIPADVGIPFLCRCTQRFFAVTAVREFVSELHEDLAIPFVYSSQLRRKFDKNRASLPELRCAMSWVVLRPDRVIELPRQLCSHDVQLFDGWRRR